MSGFGGKLQGSLVLDEERGRQYPQIELHHLMDLPKRAKKLGRWN